MILEIDIPKKFSGRERRIIRATVRHFFKTLKGLYPPKSPIYKVLKLIKTIRFVPLSNWDLRHWKIARVDPKTTSKTFLIRLGNTEQVGRWAENRGLTITNFPMWYASMVSHEIFHCLITFDECIGYVCLEEFVVQFAEWGMAEFLEKKLSRLKAFSLNID